MKRSDPSSAIVDVAAAVVTQSDRRVLLAERPAGKPWAGYWEFPGGKVETGESPFVALKRELHEELGIEVDRATPWLTREYAYPEKRVRLHFYRVSVWHGTPHGREGQKLSWEDPHAVRVAPLLPANAPILEALCLPPVYAISQAGKLGVAEFMLRLQVALQRGLRLIQVREPEMAAAAFSGLVHDVVKLAHEADARVLVSGDIGLARAAGADGVHLPGRQLMTLHEPPGRFWGASCHDARELARAAELGASLVVLSPVLPTASHPGEPGMGWSRFEALVRNYPLPVYALGGMQQELLDTAQQHGAHGVSLLSDIWRHDES